MDHELMDPNIHLSTFIQQNDHWNILKYIRIHKLRESSLVLHHGCYILFTNPSSIVLTVSSSIFESSTGCTTPTLLQQQQQLKFSNQYQTKIGYYTIIEQVCLAALDQQKFVIAEHCLRELEKQLQLNHHDATTTTTTSTSQQQVTNNNDSTSTTTAVSSSIPLSKTSIRYQLLRGRYYEAIHDMEKAQQIYTTLLLHNPSNTLAQQRQYTIIKAQPQQEIAAIEQLNQYIDTNSSYNDSSIYYELYIQYKNIGSWTYAIYCLQQVLYIISSIRNADMIHMSLLHCELAECYITMCCGCSMEDEYDTSTSITTSIVVETIRLAQKHMATALELQPSSLRVQFGLIVIANRFLLYATEKESLADSNNQDTSQNKKASHVTNVTATNEDDRLLSLSHDINVSKELIRYSTEQIIMETTPTTKNKNNNNTTFFCTKSMQVSIQALLDEYTEGL